jgi:hypothetical protein
MPSLKGGKRIKPEAALKISLLHWYTKTKRTSPDTIESTQDKHNYIMEYLSSSTPEMHRTEDEI